MRIAIPLCVFALLVSTAACGSGDGPTTPSGPPAAGSNITYSALGASDVVGFGSSKPCLPFDDCNGNGYVWVAARTLRSQGFVVSVSPRGIPAAVISRSFQDLGNQNGRDTPANLIEGEMPFVNGAATVVTIFTGANEVNTITAALGGGLGGGNPSAYIDQQANVFAGDYATLLAGVRSRAPGARIVVLNVPNVGALPVLAGASLQQRQAAQRASVRMTASINALPGVTVIDLMCDSRLYQGSNLFSDGFHPNDAGYALLGADVARAISSEAYAAPRASCPQMTLF